jgi:hypothetical protein
VPESGDFAQEQVCLAQPAVTLPISTEFVRVFEIDLLIQKGLAPRTYRLRVEIFSLINFSFFEGFSPAFLTENCDRRRLVFHPFSI